MRLDGPGLAEPIALGSRALDVLALLAERQGQLVRKDEIMTAVWPATVVEEGNLTVQISALRRVLDQGRAQGSCIQTVPGRGYRFVAPVTRSDAAPTPAVPRPGNGSGALVAAVGLLEPRPAQNIMDAIPPAPPASKSVRLRRVLIAGVAGTLCLVAAAVGAANWRWFTPRENASAPRLSIVVLPFANLSNDPDQQYLADGITEDLTTDLSRIAHTLVISSGTAFTYRHKSIDTKQIGRELGVRYVLQGSVQRSGDQVRVNTQLVDAETDRHLWADRLDRSGSDLFAVQSEITAQIGNTLNLELISAEAARPTEHPDAFDYVLRGRAISLKPSSPAVYAEAITLFEHALALDPYSVQAQAHLANEFVGRVREEISGSPAADLARAEELADRAVAEQPRFAFAHQVKGRVLQAHNRWAEAIPEFEAALALNRNSVWALHYLAVSKIFTGSIEEAIPLEQQAIRLSPREPRIGWWYWVIGNVCLLQSRSDEAIVWYEKARTSIPAAPNLHIRLAAAYGLRNDTQRGAAELAEARGLSPDDRFSSLSRLRATVSHAAARILALYEPTYFAGLRKAGMPED
jgi:adenylate cyclase